MQQLLQHLLLPLQLQQLQYLDWRVEERVGGRREWEGGERERESVRERERGREGEREIGIGIGGGGGEVEIGRGGGPTQTANLECLYLQQQ